MTNRGILVFSLDFEIFWGVADLSDTTAFEQAMPKIRQVVPRLLKLFEKYGIHATWATVGALMAKDKKELLKYLPKNSSTQASSVLNKLGLLSDNIEQKVPNCILFAPDLVEMISNTPVQELGTHTYTHYYCNNPSATPEELKDELRASAEIAVSKGLRPVSLVFPRNQVTEEYVEAAGSCGISVFRGTEKRVWYDQFKDRAFKLFRLFEKLNAYIPVVGSMSYPKSEIEFRNGCCNIKNSRFFKPFSKRWRILEPLKRLRLRQELRYAAKHGQVYHVYMHPHNFAFDTERNFRDLENFFNEFERMRNKYGAVSLTMAEMAEAAKGGQK